MNQKHPQKEAIQLELLKITLDGWQPAIPVAKGYDWTTEQLEQQFTISRQELYRIKNKPYCWRSLILVFLHLRRNKWFVYSLNPFKPGE
ncbi:MAG: hypothetical protein AAF757_15500 [Cyanobacteria bacterium P01_D01_bin.116]